MYRNVLIASMMTISTLSMAHEGGFTQEENEWLNRQYSHDGTKCCDQTDAHIGHDVAWRIVKNRYEILVGGMWIEVPPGRIMVHNPQDPTPWPGLPHAFYSVLPNNFIMIWCFFPPPLM